MYKVDTASALREATEPGVITQSILISLAIDQGPRKEAGKLFLEDGIELNALKEIRIEFLNILNIDHLWPLKNLIKLSLSHNVIERIENLDELVHLKELDLSFNRIKIMENLDNLDQLEILLFRIISNLEENEAKVQTELKLQQEFEDKLALLTAAYVEYLDEDFLFQQMFSANEVGRILSTINEDTQNAFEEYRKSFSAICHNLHELGLQEHDKRTEEIRLFELVVNEGKENKQNVARKIVDEVLERKMEIFANIKDVMKTLIEEREGDADATDDIAAKVRELFNEFNELLSKARNQLMSKEVILHDQIEDINEVFRINMMNMISSFLETAREHFSLLRNSQAEYNNTMNELILNYLSGFADNGEVPVHLKDLYGNKDSLATLAASHDIHLQVIDNREKLMTNRLDNWLKDYINQLIVDENKRNRQQILEISHFFGFLQQELNLLHPSQGLDLTDIELDDATLED
ncbi:dynein regulatory complex subunit 3-like isoform X3 [Nylanderia fulva]|uniref:dynein regulatory complex subunit 3-like isoform X3 n=1 Tax=Nylanderia fulva TaxID=613905 RepID=UPI0010FB7D79|nr:dynein regulatory complex subunit 3-like isoform X3 [Nylanderia fulva]